MSPYSKELLECFHHMDHIGEMDPADNVYYAKTGSVEQGDIVTLYLQIKDIKITKASFKSYGTVVVLAGSEFICRQLQGATLTEAEAITPESILSALQLPSLKIHSAVLLVQCLKQILAKIS